MCCSQSQREGRVTKIERRVEKKQSLFFLKLPKKGAKKEEGQSNFLGKGRLGRWGDQVYRPRGEKKKRAQKKEETKRHPIITE